MMIRVFLSFTKKLKCCFFFSPSARLMHTFFLLPYYVLSSSNIFTSLLVFSFLHTLFLLLLSWSVAQKFPLSFTFPSLNLGPLSLSVYSFSKPLGGRYACIKKLSPLCNITIGYSHYFTLPLPTVFSTVSHMRYSTSAAIATSKSTRMWK
jgi:hypothetical protein